MDSFGTYVIIGALAQLVDGALGMAYGVITTTFLLGVGLSPAATSASVHLCKIATGLASGLSHAFVGNVDRKLFIRLAVAGGAGGLAGAALLIVVNGDWMKPIVAAYLLVMGLLILRRAFRGAVEARRHLPSSKWLGLSGGFLDAIGGGGWGPIVTSSLLVKGIEPRIAVGTANMAEVFVAVAATMVFLTHPHLYEWHAIAGLIAGGVLMAPVAALASKHVPARQLMFLVGAIVMIVSTVTIVRAAG
jgi:uncharacterized membrane protein YfcA